MLPFFLRPFEWRQFHRNCFGDNNQPTGEEWKERKKEKDVEGKFEEIKVMAPTKK